MTVGVVSPGGMGSRLADSLIRDGQRVVATLDQRSPRTRRLAALAMPEQVARTQLLDDVLAEMATPAAGADEGAHT